MGLSDVKKLPVKYKEPPHADAFLVIKSGPKCGENGYDHIGPYVVDESQSEVECGACHAKLNPIWVLQRMARKETGWHRTRAAYEEEMKRLTERSSTKCRHCDRMTPISRR